MSLLDILLYLRRQSAVKRRRMLTIARHSKLLRRLRRRSRLPIPYPKGPLGGYLVPFAVIEPRRCRVHFIEIEMYAPTLLRPYWLPVQLELNVLEVAAISKIAPSSLYRVAKRFRSVRRRGGRLFFDRDDFLRYDLPELDSYCLPEPRPVNAGSEPPRGRRPGRHLPSCDRKEPAGPCSRPTKKPPMPIARRVRRAPRWTERPRTKRPAHGKPAAPDVSAREPQPQEQAATTGRPTRRTRTEAYLWRLAGGDARRYQDLVIEYSDEIAADRAAGRFAPTKNKK